MASTMVAIRIDEEEKKKVEKWAKKNDLTLSQVLRRALREFMERQAGEKKV